MQAATMKNAVQSIVVTGKVLRKWPAHNVDLSALVGRVVQWFQMYSMSHNLSIILLLGGLNVKLQ